MEDIVGATTRKNQECVAVALGRIMQKWKEPADIKTNQVNTFALFQYSGM